MTAAKNAGAANYLWLIALVAAGNIPDVVMPTDNGLDPLVPLFNASVDFTVLLLIHGTVRDTRYLANVAVMWLQCVYISIHLGAFYVRGMFQFDAWPVYAAIMNAYQPTIDGLFVVKWLALLGGAIGTVNSINRNLRNSSWLRRDLRDVMPSGIFDRRPSHRRPPQS